MADGSPKAASGPELPAFGALYRKHAGMVRRALRQLGVAPDSLDDAVQDVFVVLHRRIDAFERGRSLENWLWGIARGVASGYRRGQRRRDRLHAALPAPEDPGLPERGVARREAADILDQFLGSLDADKCAVFVLSEIEGRRGPEIAEQLQVNLNTVYARLRAARQRFDEAVADHRAPDRRPLFAGWLAWAWPGTWLGKPMAAAVGVAAIAAVVVTGPSASAPEAEAGAAERVAARSIEWVEAEPVRARPSRARAAGGATEPAPVEVPEEELVIVVDDEPAPAPAVAQPRRGGAVAAASAEPSPALVGMPDEVVLPPDVGEPSYSPWSSTIEERRPVRHASLVTLRQDFIAELLRVATRL